MSLGKDPGCRWGPNGNQEGRHHSGAERRALRPLEAEAGAGLVEEEEALAREAVWDTTGNVGRDGSLLGSDRGDAGSPDAEAA